MMLSDICLSCTSGLSREERGLGTRKTKIGTEVSHVTRDSNTTFKAKWSKVKVTGAGHIVAASRTACYHLYGYCLWNVTNPAVEYALHGGLALAFCAFWVCQAPPIVLSFR